MAALEDLIKKIDDSNLRRQIEDELRKLKSQKKFGLVFENHNEYTPLYNLPVEISSLVSLKNGEIKSQYIVTDIQGDKATCQNLHSEETLELPLDDLVSIAQFGQPIYPCLKFLDSVSHSPVSMFDNEKNNLWHVLIEAENFYALQLLVYLYEGQVDCIYIDPPYNTGAKDWKYNNDYVDSTDVHRHSKWLSFMDHRLRLAKKLLNPENSVLIVTIDEKEYLHLGCLLEEIFPEAKIQMISTVINVKGTARDNEFSRLNEYVFIARLGSCGVTPLELQEEWLGNIKSSGKDKVRLAGLLRSGTGSSRYDSPGCFYPIIVSKSGKFIRVGEAISSEIDRHSVKIEPDEIAIWPIHSDGSEGRWMYRPEGLREIISKGYVYFGKLNGDKMGITYAPRGVQKRIESGELKITGYDKKGSAILDDADFKTKYIPGNQWAIRSHNATEYGTKLLINTIGESRFSFPKSLYAVHDCLRFFVADNPDALIIDFFAGSGTTLHAVNLLNAEDGGKRRCVLVTNNELSVDEAKKLSSQGYKPGDDEYEKFGIARYVTWPRTVCSIEGHDVNGSPLKGNYIGSDMAMSEGFKSNAIFFKLGFLDRTAVRLGRQFREILSLLWMKAGCYGECPVIDEDQEVPEILILPENHMAVLNDNAFYAEFAARLEHEANIETVFLVTDSESDFRAMARGLNAKNKIQLYRDYLENFRLNYKGVK